jgi:hypothetical protein
MVYTGMVQTETASFINRNVQSRLQLLLDCEYLVVENSDFGIRCGWLHVAAVQWKI